MELLTAHSMSIISLTFHKSDANYLTSNTNIGLFLGSSQNQNLFERSFGFSSLLLGSVVKKNLIEFQKYLTEISKTIASVLDVSNWPVSIVGGATTTTDIHINAKSELWNTQALLMIFDSIYFSSKHLSIHFHGKHEFILFNLFLFFVS